MPGAPKSRVALPSAHLNCGLHVVPEEGNVRNPSIHLRWILAFETIDWSAISDYQSTGTFSFCGTTLKIRAIGNFFTIWG